MYEGHGINSEVGATLMETLVTLAIFGIAFAVFAGGMLTSVLLSGYHRDQATAETVLRSYAEAVIRDTYDTTHCSPPPTYASSFTPPAGYAVSLSNFKRLDLSGASISCGADVGLQQMRLTVSRTTHAKNVAPASESVDIVKRQP